MNAINKKKGRGGEPRQIWQKSMNCENGFNMCQGCAQDQVTKELG